MISYILPDYGFDSFDYLKLEIRIKLTRVDFKIETNSCDCSLIWMVLVPITTLFYYFLFLK